MSKESNSVKMISGGLLLVYLLSIFYFRNFDIKGFDNHGVIGTLLFVLMVVGAVGAIFLKEWGRKLLMAINFGMVFYFLLLYISRQEIILTSYAFMSCITVLFYGQEKTKIAFIGEAKGIVRKSILIIDDDPGLVKTVKPILLNKGYSVLTANTGEKGIQIAKKQLPDLVILDVILPGVKGREVCAQLKEDKDTQKIPIIFLTAKDSPDDVEAELEAGALTHITKPFSANTLLEEINKALGQQN